MTEDDVMLMTVSEGIAGGAGMAEPVGDLVVDLSLDAARLTSRWPESGVIFPVRKVMRKNSGSR